MCWACCYYCTGYENRSSSLMSFTPSLGQFQKKKSLRELLIGIKWLALCLSTSVLIHLYILHRLSSGTFLLRFIFSILALSSFILFIVMEFSSVSCAEEMLTPSSSSSVYTLCTEPLVNQIQAQQDHWSINKHTQSVYFEFCVTNQTIYTRVQND